MSKKHDKYNKEENLLVTLCRGEILNPSRNIKYGECSRWNKEQIDEINSRMKTAKG